MKMILSLLCLGAAMTAMASAPTKDSVPAEKSLQWLTNGNTRFMTGKLRADGQTTADREHLVSGQRPHAIVLSCSDSRVPPEVVFDQKLGEIFVIRTAGEALDNNVIGSIEYAVEHLGPQLLVVMGHTSCGAVTAALDTMGGQSAGTKALDALVKDIHPRLISFKGKAKSPSVANESWANAEGIAKDLAERSPVIRKRIEAGELLIVPSLYDLHSGKVTFKSAHATWSPAVDFRLISQSIGKTVEFNSPNPPIGGPNCVAAAFCRFFRSDL